jgi:hypothetical protein
MFVNILKRGETIEECYEFLLAYAAQGLPSDEGSRAGGQVREFLNRAVNALTGLAVSFRTAVKEEGMEPAGKYTRSSMSWTATLATRSRPLSWY